MKRDVILLGASAGGLEVLTRTLANLPADLPASVLVVMHIPAYGGSALRSILARAGKLPVVVADGPADLRHGVVVVAPPDHHLVVTDAHTIAARGPRENGHRPAVDVMFRTAARAVGARCVAVTLSGALDDGTAGSLAVRQRDGLVVVQDGEDALHPSMPTSVLRSVGADHVVRGAELAPLLDRLVREDVVDPVPSEPSGLLRLEADMAALEDDTLGDPEHPGKAAGYSCPDCSGTLFEIEDGGLLRYRCRVGHGWSAESLLGEQTAALDSALWIALRTTEEKAALSRELAQRASRRGNEMTARRFTEQAGETGEAARLIRSMLEDRAGFAELRTAIGPV